MKFGNLSPIVMSSSVTVNFAKPSRFSLFSFDPGGASKNAGYTTDFCSDFVLDLSHDGLILLSTNLIEKYVDLKFVMPILVFDPGGSLSIDFSVVQHRLHAAMNDGGR